MEQTIAPYGEWESPITARMLAEAGRPLGFAALVGDRVWWSESRPDQGGRTTVMASGPDGSAVELLPPPWNARTRVHEYGGVAWIAVPSGSGHALVFAHFDDQRVYRLDPDGDEPVPLTPEPDEPAALRYADFVPGRTEGEVLAVRERHHGKDLERHIVAIALDGSGVREIVSGSHFLANPRVSPDGRRLAWLAWEHPQMPWDGTELRVGAFGSDGTISGFQRILGGPTESLFQPEWADDETLYVVSDRSGWWNLYRLAVPRGGLAEGATAEPEPLHPTEEEFGAPLWQLGMRTYGLLPDGRLLTVHGERIGVLDPASGTLTDFDLPYPYFSASLNVAGSAAALLVGGPTTPLSVARLDTSTGHVEILRQALDADRLPDPAYLPVPESTTLHAEDGRDIHVHIYKPSNPRYTAPESEKPPYVVFVHGGPTSASPAVLSGLDKAYFTSRGIGVLDVNYGGSTGYGRAYRERLRGQWGVVDVEDCESAAKALAERGDADPKRLAIRGGSAGGWTTLCAVTRSDVFAAGTSLFGVSDAQMLVETTHDFESRYLDGLLGPLPEAADVVRERSPLTHAAETRCPVLLLQGADDPVVPLQQAEVFRDALAGKGIPHALLVFEGEQHGFRKAESIVAAAEAELSFYGQVMGFRPPGVPVLELSS